MKKVLSVMVATVCVAAFSAVASAQLANGNLDVGLASDGTLPGTAPPWTLNNVGNATAAQFQAGFADSTGGNGIWFRSFLGNTTTPVSATFSQTAVALASGPYQLTFDYLVEQNFTAQSMLATLSSTSGGTATLDLNAVPRTAINGGFSANPAAVGSLLINANAGDTLTVSLAMLNGQTSGLSGGQTVMADRFNLALVPEPSTMALGLAALMGLVAVRRR
jgi:hypothetical protein